jgi:hypothetical protein
MFAISQAAPNYARRALLAKQKPGAYLRVLKTDALTGASEIIIIFQITAPSKHFITSGVGAL